VWPANAVCRSISTRIESVGNVSAGSGRFGSTGRVRRAGVECPLLAQSRLCTSSTRDHCPVSQEHWLRTRLKHGLESITTFCLRGRLADCDQASHCYFKADCHVLWTSQIGVYAASIRVQMRVGSFRRKILYTQAQTAGPHASRCLAGHRPFLNEGIHLWSSAKNSHRAIQAENRRLLRDGASRKPITFCIFLVAGRRDHRF